MVVDPDDADVVAGPRTDGGHPRLSVVIVDHRRPEVLADALWALYSSERRPDEIVAVDVESVSPPLLPVDEQTDEGPITRLLAIKDNPGYAIACNRGAAETTGDWILFMNSDVMVDPTCLAGVMEEAMSDASIGITTCRLVLPDGRIDHACHRGIPTPFDSLAYKARLDRLFPGSRRLGHYRMSWLDPDDTHDVEACSGAFLLIRREALDAVGGWDERYWFYAEDLDLCLRVSQAGWRIRYVGSRTAVHLKGASSNLRRRESELTPDQVETRRRVQRAIVDSHERFYHEHLEDGTARPLRPMVRGMFVLQRYFAGRSR